METYQKNENRKNRRKKIYVPRRTRRDRAALSPHSRHVTLSRLTSDVSSPPLRAQSCRTARHGQGTAGAAKVVSRILRARSRLSANGTVVRAAGRTTSLTKMRQRPKAFAKAISPDTHAECTPGTARESTSLAITCTSHPEEAHSVERIGACDSPARRGRALLFSRFAHCHGRSTPRVPRMFHWPSSSPCAPPSVTPASPSSGSKRSASEGSSCSPRSSKKS